MFEQIPEDPSPPWMNILAPGPVNRVETLWPGNDTGPDPPDQPGRGRHAKTVHKRRLSHIIRKIRTGTPVDCEETDWYARMAVDYQWQEPCRNALMLTDRNDRWMAILSDLLEQHNCFIAVD